jgi:hypothetical protein
MGAVAFSLSACASTSGGTTGGTTEQGVEGEGVEFVVINDRTPPAPITVYLVPETGGRRRLGTLQPNGRQTFRHAPAAPSQEFQLVADAVGEGDVESERFTLLDVNQIEWSTSNRTVRVR